MGCPMPLAGLHPGGRSWEFGFSLLFDWVIPKERFLEGNAHCEPPALAKGCHSCVGIRGADEWCGESLGPKPIPEVTHASWSFSLRLLLLLMQEKPQ